MMIFVRNNVHSVQSSPSSENPKTFGEDVEKVQKIFFLINPFINFSDWQL